MGLDKAHETARHGALQVNGKQAPSLRPAVYPPPGLQGLRSHDPKRWGPLLSDAMQGLVRVADLVRLIGDRTGLPTRPASRQVLAELGRHGTLPLFTAQPGELFRLVAADDVWRPRYRSGAEQLAAWQALGRGPGAFILPLWSLSDDENAARCIVIADGVHSGMVPADLVKLPELPELRGAAGAVEWLRVCWAERATTFEELDEGTAAGLAMLQADAVRLFSVAAAGDAPPATSDAPKAEQGPAAPPQWPPAKDYKGNIALHEYWVSAGGEAGHATAHLAAYYRVSHRCIQQRIAPFHPSGGPGGKRATAGKARPRKAGTASGEELQRSPWLMRVTSPAAK